MSTGADTDLAIVGSGFGGSILAMIARRLGYRVMLLERGRHPRFAIGESASPLAGVLIEQLADRYDLPRLRPLSAFGTWQRAYPDVVCGLKRGFTYFKHETGQRYVAAADRSNQLLVAASPSDELSDTHWLRADVDHFLVREAIALGADYLDETALDQIQWHADGAATLTGTRRGASVRLRAGFVVDASGPRGFLSRALNIREQGFDSYPGIQALYSHFTDVARCDDMPDFETGSGIRDSGLETRDSGFGTRDSGFGTRDSGFGTRDSGNGESRIPDPESRVPYPIDDAALHHVFDGGWMWVLRFGNGVTSAGIAVVDSLARELRLADGAPAWERFLSMYPSIAAQFAGARPIREFTWMPRVAYRAAQAAGERWAMLPSAAAFIDPLFSTGIPLTLLGIERIAQLLTARRGGPSGPPVQGAPEGAPLRTYNDVTLAEADHTAGFVAGCYATFPRFEAFTAYSMFYFAAASFSEMRRRLTPELASAGFLRAGDATFASALADLSPAVRVPDADFFDRVKHAIAAINIAGLCDPARQNWYPVDLEDTIRSAHKLGLTPERVREALEFANVTSTPHVSRHRRDRSVDVGNGSSVGR